MTASRPRKAREASAAELPSGAPRHVKLGLTHALNVVADWTTFAIGFGATSGRPVSRWTSARTIASIRSSHVCTRTVRASLSGTTGSSGLPSMAIVFRKSSYGSAAQKKGLFS